MLRVSFSQAARGTNKDVQINVVDTCPKCTGSRCEPGTKAIKCQFCNGTGMESITTGPFVMRSTCRYCQGTRMYIKYKCTECEGKGSTVQRRKVTIPVPAGKALILSLKNLKCSSKRTLRKIICYMFEIELSLMYLLSKLYYRMHLSMRC